MYVPVCIFSIVYCICVFIGCNSECADIHFFELCTVLMFIMAEILVAPLFKRQAFLFEKIAASDTVLAFWVLSVQSKIDK